VPSATPNRNPRYLIPQALGQYLKILPLERVLRTLCQDLNQIQMDLRFRAAPGVRSRSRVAPRSSTHLASAQLTLSVWVS